MNISIHESDIKAKANVDAILSFHQTMINDGKSGHDNLSYFTPDYVQHNPLMATGAESAVKFFRSLSDRFPHKHIVVHHVIAVEDWVWVHFNFFTTLDKTELGVAGVDIYRFDNEGKIAEHWDASQPVTDPKKALNSNGMF